MLIERGNDSARSVRNQSLALNTASGSFHFAIPSFNFQLRRSRASGITATDVIDFKCAVSRIHLSSITQARSTAMPPTTITVARWRNLRRCGIIICKDRARA